jgi:hypothetical protein
MAVIYVTCYANELRFCKARSFSLETKARGVSSFAPIDVNLVRGFSFFATGFVRRSHQFAHANV